MHSPECESVLRRCNWRIAAADLVKQRQAECYERGGQLYIHEPV
jgi:hypothetical protein